MKKESPTTEPKTSPKPEYKTPSGVSLQPFYGPANGLAPGEFPFTRGIHPTMYRGRPWTMRQYAGFGSAAEANERYRYLLANGTTGLSVAFDLPTQMGRDPDHPISNGEVGKVGVSVASADDMEELLSGIPLESISLSMTINATAAMLLAFVLVVAERRGVAWDKLTGTTQNDILKEYIARGTYIFPITAGMRLATDIIEFCGSHVPQWNTISISGYHIREAGSTAVQEVAFTLADGIAYVEAAKSRGLSVDEFGKRLSFFFNCHNDFFEEVAKFRAARRMWAAIMKDRFGATDPRAMMLRFHTQTAGSSLTAQQPVNNVVRTTVQALAAVCGGTQSLHTNSYDEALGLPTDETAKLALRTQQVIANESGAIAVADPLGGSFFIEALTDEIEREATKIIQKIDQSGGMLKAIDARFPQAEIERAAYDYQRSIETEQRIIVGVNRFADSEADNIKVETLKINSGIEAQRVTQVRTLRARRNAAEWEKSLNELRLAALKDGSNLLGPIVAAARVGATVGEMSDVLRAVFGEYREA